MANWYIIKLESLIPTDVNVEKEIMEWRLRDDKITI